MSMWTIMLLATSSVLCFKGSFNTPQTRWGYLVLIAVVFGEYALFSWSAAQFINDIQALFLVCP